MSKNHFQPGLRGDSTEGSKATNSVIVGPQPSFLFRKNKGDDPYNQKIMSMVARYGSEDQLKKLTSDTTTRPEQQQKGISNIEKNQQQQNARRIPPKDGFFRTRYNKIRAPVEPVSYHRSEKALPSFIRGQNKSQERFKTPQKKGLRKQNFKILRRLGQGKFGNVFLARENITGMIVALKVLPKRKIIEDNFLTQFTRQLKIQTFLDHPNIINTYGFFSDQESFYTVMELGCDGQLYDIIATGETLSEESTSFIIGNLLEAVSVLHAHTILHRDIKPENIVLVHGNVKLCDFGWAVHKKEELRSTLCGTPLYLSPELIQGSRYDEKVDLWAIGILAYELHIGTSPFNISQQQDLIKIVTSEVQFPSNRKVSKQFRQFIRQILKKNPKERRNCKQLLDLTFIRKYRQFETCEQLCQ